MHILVSCWKRNGHKRSRFSCAGTFLIMRYIFRSYTLSWHLPLIASHSTPFLGSPCLCLCPSDVLSKNMAVHHTLVKCLGDTHTPEHSTGSSIWTLWLKSIIDTFFGLLSATSQVVSHFCHFSGGGTTCQAARGHKTSSVDNTVWFWLQF